MVCEVAIVCTCCQNLSCKTIPIATGMLFVQIAGFTKRCSYIGLHSQMGKKAGLLLLRFVLVYSEQVIHPNCNPSLRLLIYCFRFYFKIIFTIQTNNHRNPVNAINLSVTSFQQLHSCACKIPQTATRFTKSKREKLKRSGVLRN